MKKTLLLLLLTMMATAWPASARQFTDHLLVIGICPPWKTASPAMCRRSGEAVTAALKSRLAIPSENVTTVYNEEATTEGLHAAITALKSLDKSDRLFIFANLHAGSIDPNQPAGPDNDVFVMWTKTQPQVTQFAVAEGDWIMAKTFAGWVHAIPAGAIVVILDACESGAVTPLFINQHPNDLKARPEAVIVSAAKNQIANFSRDLRIALFSQQFARAVTVTTTTMRDAFDTATANTIGLAKSICEGKKSALLKAGLDPLACRQRPEFHDPAGILPDIVFVAPATSLVSR